MGIKLRIATVAASMVLISALSTPVEAKNVLNSLLGGSRGAGNSQVFQVELSNFSTRQAQLRSQISTAVSSGQISVATAQSLTAQLDNLAAQTQQQASAGAFAPGQAEAIVAAFGNITNQLSSSTISTNANGYYNNGYNSNYNNGYTGYNNGYSNYNPYPTNNGYNGYSNYNNNGYQRQLGGLGRFLGY